MLALSPEKWTPVGFVWGFVIVGGLISAAGLIWIAHTAWFLSRATQTTGVVVAVTAINSTRNPGDDSSDKQVTSYYPVVEYHSTAGGKHRLQSTRAARSNQFKIGDEVGVYHHPTKPAQALLRDPWMLWFSPGVILAGGLIWLLMAGGALLLVKKFDTNMDRDRDGFLRRVSAAAQRKP